MPIDKHITFNRIACAMLRQRVQSKTNMGCSYAGANDTACAIGLLNRGWFVENEFEGPTLADLSYDTFADIVANPTAHEKDLTVSPYIEFTRMLNRETGATTAEDFAFLREFQCIHDNTPSYLWHMKLAELASKHYVVVSKDFNDQYDEIHLLLINAMEESVNDYAI